MKLTHANTVVPPPHPEKQLIMGSTGEINTGECIRRGGAFRSSGA